jgi:hypothetical protein
MKKFLTLPSGVMINVDAIAALTPIKNVGVIVSFVDGDRPSLDLKEDDSIDLLAKLKDRGEDVEDIWMAVWGGKPKA